MASATIKLFLPRGDAKSLRTAEISNWNGIGLAAPRTELDELLCRSELSRAGVYILIGSDPKTELPLAYIGESDLVRGRIKDHRSREFWVSAIVFVTKDESLTKAHVRHLERKLVEGAISAGRVKLTQVAPGGSSLPESDREDMDVFFSRIRQILPVLGSDILVPVVQRIDHAVLFCRVKGAEARGQRTPDGFVVFKGSTAALEDRPSAFRHQPQIVARRQKLIQEGVLIPRDGFLLFTRDIEFSSPSYAYSMIQGGGPAARIHWRTKDGTTLKQLDEQP